MSGRMIEERHGFPGALRAWEGTGGHLGAPARVLSRSAPAPPGRDERRGGMGGHLGAPHVDR